MALPFPAPHGGSRVRIFVPVFAVACAAALAWVFARPAVYASTARVQIEVSKRVSQTAAPDVEAVGFPDIVQSLTGSELIERAARSVGVEPDAFRAMVKAVPLPGANVVELRAEGGTPELPARVLEAWMDAWRDQHAEQGNRAVVAALEQARADEAERERELAARRRDLAEFRSRHGIVSGERDENRVASQIKGLNTALAEARSRELTAEARLAALREAVAAGRGAAGLPQSAPIAEHEKRAAELKERMRELEQNYTPQYLALDNRYKTMVTALARIEQQIAVERRALLAQALHKAEEDLAASRHTVARLEKELAARRAETQDFTARFAEHAAIARDVARLEEARAAAAARHGELAARAKASRSKLTVLARPTVSIEPDRPDYLRDSVLGVAGSGALGFLAVWCVEFFRREPSQPAVPAQPVVHISLPPQEWGIRESAGHGRVIEASASRIPAALTRLPRELSREEVGLLWAAAAPDARLAIAGLLSGLSAEEIAALRFENVDFRANVVTFPGLTTRSCTLREPLRGLLAQRRGIGGSAAPLSSPSGEPMTPDDVEGLVTCAAHDAGLDHPGEVSAEVLRHTYFAYLVRQGARLAEIGEFIGRFPPARFRHYAPLSPPGPGVPLEEIDPVYPVLRELRHRAGGR